MECEEHSLSSFRSEYYCLCGIVWHWRLLSVMHRVLTSACSTCLVRRLVHVWDHSKMVLQKEHLLKHIWAFFYRNFLLTSQM